MTPVNAFRILFLTSVPNQHLERAGLQSAVARCRSSSGDCGFIAKVIGEHPDACPSKANSLGRAPVDVVCSLRDSLRMRQVLFSVIVIIGLTAGCVESKDTRGAAPSVVSQLTLPGSTRSFSHPRPIPFPAGSAGTDSPGYELVVHTQQFAAPYVGNRLTCANCHWMRDSIPIRPPLVRALAGLSGIPGPGGESSDAGRPYQRLFRSVI